ncbi:MAG: DNA primase [Kiritimatiellia bacterium]
MAAIIDSNIIEEIRARVDIVELIRERVEIKKSGSSFKGRCPFHNEKTPSFTVNPTRQSYKCFGCGAGGDAFKFVMEYDGLTFIEAVRQLADRVGVVIEEKHDKYAGKRKMLYALHAELADFYQRCLNETKDAAAVRKYLNERNLDRKTLETFSIGYAPPRQRKALLRWADKTARSLDDLEAAGIVLPPLDGRTELYDRFQDRLIFPVRDAQGRVVAFSARIYDRNDKRKAKYVNSPETEIFIKGRVLYGLDKAASKIVRHPRREAIICEGQIDVIRCHSCGFETAVASQGTSFSKDHVRLLKRYADCAVLVFDGDAAGKKAAVRTGALLLEEGVPVRVATMPAGEDPDSVLCKRGYDVFRSIIERAESIIAFQIESMRSVEEHPESIDAVGRVSHGVLETLAGCSSSVIASSLLQEASDILHLPLSAMEEDLREYRKKAKRRGSFAKKEGKPRKQKKVLSPDVLPVSGSSDECVPSDEEPPLPDGPFGPPVDEDGNELEYVLGPEVEVPTDKENAPAPPAECEKALCEMLLEHEHDLQIINMVIRYLPLDVIKHPFVRDFVRAVIDGSRENTDKLAALYRTVDVSVQPFFTSLLNHQHKMLGAVEATSEEAMQDIIRRIWMIYYRDEQGALPAESSPENDSRRLHLSCLIKELQNGLWKNVQKYMITAAEPIKADDPFPIREACAGITPDENSEAASFLYEGDNAYACCRPGESQPSECPPDEIPDL